MPIPVKSPIHKDPIYFAHTANFDKEMSMCVCVFVIMLRVRGHSVPM